MTTQFRREIQLSPPFDRRDLDPSRNYGIEALTIRMLLHGPDLTVQFVFSTRAYLSSVTHQSFEFFAIDLGYHSKKPHYEHQHPMNCNIFGTCYYDGSTLNAEPVLKLFLEKGEGPVWEFLEKYWHDVKGAEA